MRLGFAGTPDFAVPALAALHREFAVVGVFTQPDRPAGRGRSVHMSAVKQRALQFGLPVHQPATLRSEQSLATLRSLDAALLVVVAYGQILPQAALDTPRLGCLNIHASLLPRWRGAAPIQRAILAGDDETGVTIMQMESGLDTGPIFSRQSVPITTQTTAASLHDTLSELGAAMIVATVHELAAGKLTPTVQPADGVTYAEKLSKSEANIDWRATAMSVGRRVRAFNPWPVAETRWQGEQLRIWDATVLASAPVPATPGTVLAATQAGIDVACGDGVLRVTRLQLAGRKALGARDFVQGLKAGQALVGACLGATAVAS